MKKIVLTQDQVDKLVVVDRVTVEPSLHGVGLNDVIFKTYIGGVLCWQYKLWYAMLARCFNEGVKDRQPTYKDVTCCGEWLSFGNFLEWVNKEVGYKGKMVGFALDKDLIVKGNKVYSPETCSFVPRVLNNLLNSRAYSCSKTPLGVFHQPNGTYRANISEFGRTRLIGVYENEVDAFTAYKLAKNAYLSRVMLRYKDVIKPTVYSTVLSWFAED